MNEHIEQQLKRLPAKPGVYLFRDAGGRVLYIGKAKSLRPRVRSYFQRGSGDNRAQIGQLPSRVAERLHAVRIAAKKLRYAMEIEPGFVDAAIRRAGAALSTG